MKQFSARNGAAVSSPRSPRGVRRSKGLNIFLRTEDPSPFVCVRSVHRQSIFSFPTSRLLFCPAGTRSKRLRSRLLCRSPPPRHPRSARFYPPTSAFTSLRLPAALFPVFDGKRAGRKRGKKARVMPVQGTLSSGQPSETADAARGFRLTDNQH